MATLNANATSFPSMCAKQSSIVTIIASAVITWLSPECEAEDLTGPARVIAGDTTAVASRHVRLQGIDAPETDQVCLDVQAERWTCGIAARERLSSHIASRGIT